MGLFSKKKVSHSIEEAIANKDEEYAYTTKKGHTYRILPTLAACMQNHIVFDDLDDMYEMFAPNLVSLLADTNKKLNVLIEQNEELKRQNQQLAEDVNQLKSQIRHNDSYTR